MDTVRNFTKRQLKNGPIMFLLSEIIMGASLLLTGSVEWNLFGSNFYASLVPMDVWTTEILPWV